MCFGQTTLKIRVIYTLSSNKKPLEHQCIGAPKQHRKARPYSAEEKPYGRARYLSPKARHTVGTHTGTKPNNRHLPQVTASKPSSGQPAAGSGT